MDEKSDLETLIEYNCKRDTARENAVDAVRYIWQNIKEATSIAFYLFTGERDSFCKTPIHIKDCGDARSYIDEWNSKIHRVIEDNNRYGFDFPSKVIEYIHECRFESFKQAFEKIE